MKYKGKIISFVILFVITFSVINQKQSNGAVILINAVLKTNGGGMYPDYGLMIQQDLRDIGIEIEIKVEEWTVFMGTLSLTHDYDIGIRTLDFSLLDPDPTGYYSTENPQNPENLDTQILYANESSDILRLAQSNTNQTERFESYVEWSNLVLDKIAHIFPLFNEREIVYFYDNTHGYETRWGLADNLPYMFYDGFHSGQVSLDEFRFALPYWVDLNVITQKSYDTVSDKISDLIYEPIIQVNPHTQIPLTTGLVDNWQIINDTHYRFHVRENLYWSPSFNITERISDTLPLNSSDVDSLMVGLKGEHSNGTNQMLTAKDIVFSLLSYSNPLVSSRWAEYEWIREIKIDPLDEFIFDLIVDGNPDTPALEHYAPIWSKLKISCLPEFFLNSTSLNITQSSGGVEMVGLYEDIIRDQVWRDFSKSAFGCGKYLLDYNNPSVITGLISNPNWYNVGAIDGSYQTLDIPKISIRCIRDESDRLSEFEAGNLDLYEPRVPFDTPVANPPPGITIHTSLSDKVSCLFFNLQSPFFAGIQEYENCTYEGKEDYSKGSAIRKAICYAIDRNRINEIMNERWYSLQHGLISHIFTSQYTDEIFDYEYDLVTANEWMTGEKPAPPVDSTISFKLGGLGIIILSSAIYKMKKLRSKKNYEIKK